LARPPNGPHNTVKEAWLNQSLKGTADKLLIFLAIDDRKAIRDISKLIKIEYYSGGVGVSFSHGLTLRLSRETIAEFFNVAS
jgi:hypothetical protein